MMIMKIFCDDYEHVLLRKGASLVIYQPLIYSQQVRSNSHSSQDDQVNSKSTRCIDLQSSLEGFLGNFDIEMEEWKKK